MAAERGNTSQDWGSILQGADCDLRQHSACGVVSPTAGTHESRSHSWIEMGVALLTVIPSGPLAKYLFPIPAILNSQGRDIPTRGHNNTSTKSVVPLGN